MTRASLLLLLLLVSAVSVTLAAPCTKNDYYGEYTACRPPRYVRDALYRWLAPLPCDPTDAASVRLPSNVYDVSCNVTCNAGFYLPVGASSCEACSKGSVAMGGGVLVSEWKQFPNASVSNGNLRFSTRCEYNANEPYAPGPARGCAGWQLNGWNVRSGNVSDYETSVFEASVTLLRAGSVAFDYYVSAENGFDGLVFLIDKADRLIMSNESDLPLVSNTPQLTSFRADLSAGVHTLTWKYFKDFLTADGDDLAYIKNLQILGTAYADDFCSPCPAGTEAPAAQSAQCTPCPANKVAPNVGTAQCTACDPDHEFSRPGATVCSPRALCKASDYRVVRTLCQLDPTFAGGRSRQQTYEWLQPKLCDSVANNSVQLPLPSAVACQPCLGGYRRSENVTACTACPAGTAGGGAVNAPCATCGNGEAAVRQLVLDGAVQWPPNMTTSCTGTCASNGWRLTDDGIDSGVGHGGDAQVTLTWVVDVPTLAPQPYVDFVTTLDCGFLFGTDSCQLMFSVSGDGVFRSTVTLNTYAYRRRSRVYFIAAGRRTLTWTFVKEVSGTTSDDAQRRYRALLNSITLVGATLGGAPTCVKCPAGSVSPIGSDSCVQCPAGTGPNVERTACEQCPLNQFAPDVGGGCRVCPPGTRRLSPTACDDGDCQYRDGARQYDLTPLKQSRPYEATSGTDMYELNVCRTNRSSNVITACVDEKGRPLSAFACQVLASGIAVSLGDEIGFYPYRVAGNDSTTPGVTVRYASGELCTSVNVERSVNITIVCDPLAGRGAPVPCDNGVEPRICNYCFQWRSLYGCPVCGAQDRQQVYSECRLGYRRAFWKWRDDRQCWGGTLPAPTTVPCVMTSISCPAGQMLPPGTTDCLACPNGTFSLGTGTEYFSFDQTLDLFRTPTSSAVGRWSFRGASMHSGDDTSEMALTVSFVTTGSIDFGYVMLGDRGTFKLLQDNQVILTARALATPSRFVRDGLKGDVTFTWRFENGSATLLELSQLQKVIVYDLRTIGTEWAAPDCDACPRGTVARNNATSCRLCFNNTIATNAQGVSVDSGATDCTPCRATEFSYPGRTKCLPREPACDIEGVHYDVYYTPCIGGQRTKYYKLVRRCVDTSTFDALTNSTEACVPASVCPIGQYLRLDTGNCTAVPAGHVPVKSRMYLSPLSTSETALLDLNGAVGAVAVNNQGGGIIGANGPNGNVQFASLRVITGCVAISHARAQCGGGWRSRGSFAMDSGDQGDEWIDSLLVIRGANDTFAVGDAPGELQFDATFSDPGAPVGQLESTAAQTALYVYYAGDLLLTVTKRGTYNATLPVRPLAEQNITFRYHQWELENRTRACVVANITIRSTVGLATGVRRCQDAYTPSVADGVCVPCPAGTSSVMGGACTPCTNNTFAPTPGSMCVPCGPGGTAARPATRCFTTCKFTVPDAKKKLRTFDLTDLFNLDDKDDIITVDGRSDSQFLLSPCGAAVKCGSETSAFAVEKMRTGGACTVMGTHANFTLSNTADFGFNIDYSVFGVPTSQCPEGKRVTRIVFLCQPDAGVGQPMFIESLASTDQPRCTATFVWVSSYGCPKCTDADYVLEKTECVENKRNATLLRHTNECNGPQFITDTAAAKSYKKYAMEPLGEVECGEVYEFPFWILAVVAGVIGLIVLIGAGVCVSNARLRRQYRKLRDQAVGVFDN